MEASKVIVLIGSIAAFLGLIGYAVYLLFFKKAGGKANPQLVSYIQAYASQGYDMASLKQGLLSQGYAEKDIDAAIQAVQKG